MTTYIVLGLLIGVVLTAAVLLVVIDVGIKVERLERAVETHIGCKK